MSEPIFDSTFDVFVASIVMIVMLLASIYGWDALCEWWERRQSRAASPPLPTDTGSSSVVRAPTAAPPAPVLAPHEWLHRANDLPDVAPHLLIVGKSGSGKTTLARAILSYRSGQIVVITPKPEDAWGVPTVSLDADAGFSRIAHTMQALYRELLQRDAGSPPLHIVIDDYPILASDKQSKEAATQLVRSVARLGRSKRVRLLLLAQESTATATGTHGEHALLYNFTRFDCHKHTHQIVLTWDDEPFVCQGKHVPRLAARGLTHLAVWQPPEPLDMPVPVRTSTDGLGDAEAVCTSTYQYVPLDTGTAVPPDEQAMIRALLDQGFSKNAIAKLLGGSKTTAYERIKQASEVQR